MACSSELDHLKDEIKNLEGLNQQLKHTEDSLNRDTDKTQQEIDNTPDLHIHQAVGV